MNMFDLFKYGPQVIVKLTKYGLQVIFKLTKLRSALIEHFSIHKNPKAILKDRRDSRAGQQACFWGMFWDKIVRDKR